MNAPVALPPGPTSPPLWQLTQYSARPLQFIEDCARRYGDPFTVTFGRFGTLVFLADPEAVREVFRGDPAVLHAGKGNNLLAATVGNSSVLVLDDEPHARARRLMQPPLKGERMRAFFGAMREETLAAATAWPRGPALRMDVPMRRITLRVMLRSAFGLAPGPAMDDIERRMTRSLDHGNNPFVLVLAHLFPHERYADSRWVPYYRAARHLDEALFAHIRAARALPPEERGVNVLADLLAAQREDGQPLTDAEVRDGIVTVLAAGHETTALTLAWTLECIASTPGVSARIEAELAALCGGGPLLPEHVDRLEWLDAVIRESMRLRTVLPFVVRTLQAPVTVGGRTYPAGINLAPSMHLVHHREDLYPEPWRYRPERFLERKFGGHEWFPFGGGHRACIGAAFALYEMKVILATLFQTVRFERPAGAVSRPVRRGISIGPGDGVRLHIRRGPAAPAPASAPGANAA